jgi:hypothetical protein
MFLQGMNMEEIARTRGLTIGTIVTHLEYYVRLGEVKLEQVVEIEKVMKIHQYLQGKENPGIAELKAALGDEISYTDIRFVFASDAREYS